MGDSEGAFSYNCLMWTFDCVGWKDVITTYVDNKHLWDPTGGYGFEFEPHVTILFGLKEHVMPEDIAIAWENIGKITPEDILDDIKFKKLSTFEQDDYDVLKISVESELLNLFNEEVSKLPNENEYPAYKPHLTIAYLENGKGENYKYLRPYHLFEKHHIKNPRYTYSTTEGKKIILKT